MAKPNNREAILDAAEAVVMAQGAGNLTLDSVADAAGVSKGGLLYHFPTKESLLSGMIERMVSRFRQRRADAVEASPVCCARTLFAHISAHCTRDPRLQKLGCTLLAASANDPRLTEPLRERFREEVRSFFTSVGDFPSAAILFLAGEGMAKLDLLGINPFTPAERDTIHAEILRRVQELQPTTPAQSE